MKYSLIDDYIGAKLRERRIELNLRLTATAEHFGLSKQRLRNYEQGINSFPFDLFVRICRYYELDPEALFEEATEYLRKEAFKECR